MKIVSREVGTGYIGGKSVGMLLARKIIKNADGAMADIQRYLEPDDSFLSVQTCIIPILYRTAGGS